MWSSGSNLFGTLCFLDLYVYFLCQLGKFSFIIFSNKFSISCSPSPSGTPLIQMLVLLEISQSLLSLSSFFKILFSPFCSDGMLFSSLCSKSLIWFLASSLPLLVSYRFFFISLNTTCLSLFLCCWSTVWVPECPWICYLRMNNFDLFRIINLYYGNSTSVLKMRFFWIINLRSQKKSVIYCEMIH